MRTIKDIEIKINQLTPDLIEELDKYLDYLINKRSIKKSGKLTQDWAGGLKGENHNSIDLQKKHLIEDKSKIPCRHKYNIQDFKRSA